MTTRNFLPAIFTNILIMLFSCGGLSGSKGEFNKPVTGKALSLTVMRVSGGLGTYLNVRLEITNPSGAKVLITPIKVKVFHDDGTETERVYELKRKSLQQIEIKGGDILSGTLGIGNPNQSEQVQAGTPAFLLPGEITGFTSTGFKSNPDKVQVFIGQEGSNEQEVFLISE